MVGAFCSPMAKTRSGGKDGDLKIGHTTSPLGNINERLQGGNLQNSSEKAANVYKR